MSINAIGSNIPGAVQFGLTDDNTFPVGSVLQGNGTSAVTTLSSTINGQTLIGATSAAAAFENITAGTNITITNAPHSITIDYTGSGGGTLIPFTPSIFTSSPPVWTTFPTYSLQNGFYITFGKLQIISIEMTLTSKGTVTQVNPPVIIYIVGFPNFNSVANIGAVPYAAVLEENGIGGPTLPFSVGTYTGSVGAPTFNVLRPNSIYESYNTITNTTTYRIISMYITA